MPLKLIKPYLLILQLAVLLVATNACNNRNKQVNNKAGGKLLKYTSGVRAFLEDTSGNIWFGSNNEGVCLLHNGKFSYFTTQNGLSNNQVRNIYEDQHGVIWFECGRGLSTYDGKKMAVYKARDYESVSKWTLNDKDLWFKGDEIEGYNKLEKNAGVYQYDGHKLWYRTFPVTPENENERRFHYAISTPFFKSKNGTVWFGAYKALIGYNGTDFKIITDQSLDLNGVSGFLHIRGFLEDSKGNFWIANNGSGVLKYNGKEAVNFTEQQKLTKADTKGNSLERAFSVGEDTLGNMWFGTVDCGVWRYDGKTVKNFTQADGLQSKHIWTIYKTKQGELWFGGANPCGVFRFNGEGFERIY